MEEYRERVVISSKIPWKYQKIIAIIGIPFIIIVIILALTVCNPMTVVTQGTVLSIQPQHHVQYGFTRPPNSEGATYGAFTTDNGVTLYVMTASQFNNFTPTGDPSSFVYSTGQVTSGSLNFGKNGGNSYAYIKPPGQYYFMFYNAGTLTSTVTVTNALQVETC